MLAPILRHDEVEIDYLPRPHFRKFHYRPQRWACLVCHRRAGKTVATINDKIRRAVTENKPDGRYGFIAPYRQQAKDIAWTYLKKFAAPLLSEPPRESELSVRLLGGQIIRLYGADNPDAIRGAYFDGVTLDEFADMRPSLWGDVVRPMLADRQGWATFIGTPKGKNEFYEVYKDACKRPSEWFTVMLKSSESGILPKEELDAALEDMGKDRYEQEFECSFEAAIKGAYFAEGMAQAKGQGRIGRISADPLLPLKAFFDLGGAGARADAMAIWICQFVAREIRVLDYITGVGQVLAYYVNILRSKGYDKALCVLPHDGVNVNNLTGKRYQEHLEDAGFETEVVSNQGAGAVMMRIEAVRRILPRCWFNEAATEVGRNALTCYHERRDELRSVGLGPEHDKYSHAADAFGLMAIYYEEPQAKQTRRESSYSGVRNRSAWGV